MLAPANKPVTAAITAMGARRGASDGPSAGWHKPWLLHCPKLRSPPQTTPIAAVFQLHPENTRLPLVSLGS
jgi:hypothetical protein